MIKFNNALLFQRRLGQKKWLHQCCEAFRQNLFWQKKAAAILIMAAAKLLK
jgi:hypothetical protein